MLLVRPRRRIILAFACYAIGTGIVRMAINLYPYEDPMYRVMFNVVEPLFVVYGLALFLVILWFPRPLHRTERPALVKAALVFLAVELVWFATLGPHLFFNGDYLDAPSRYLDPRGPTVLVPFWLGTAYLLLPFRFGAVGGANAAADRRHLALLAGVLGFGPAIASGLAAGSFSFPIAHVALLEVAFALLMVVLWTSQAARVPAREARLARNVALVWTGFTLLGLALVTVWGPDEGALAGTVIGIVQVATLLLLAYSILRHQLLGIDVRIKWTIKQSTMAAIFIGLFFIVSESAAAFFSDRVGTYLGIVAAGALVFAIAPLQHFAQRVADRAMPGVKAVDEMTHDERARIYREQTLAAWADGSIDRSERLLLDRLQTSLRLEPAAAMRIEQEAARRSVDDTLGAV